MQAVRSPKGGDCAFAADPTKTALEQDIIWSPAIDPGSILLQPSPCNLSGPEISEREDGSDPTATMRSASFIEFGDTGFSICFPSGPRDGPMSATILLDAMTLDRLEAVHRLWAALFNKAIPPDMRITRQKLSRARQSLRAVDGWAVGASYREIAQALFPKHRTSSASWNGDAIRETTIRLVRDGKKLVQGGYKALLHRSRRGRMK